MEDSSKAIETTNPSLFLSPSSPQTTKLSPRSPASSHLTPPPSPRTASLVSASPSSPNLTPVSLVSSVQEEPISVHVDTTDSLEKLFQLPDNNSARATPFPPILLTIALAISLLIATLSSISFVIHPPVPVSTSSSPFPSPSPASSPSSTSSPSVSASISFSTSISPSQSILVPSLSPSPLPDQSTISRINELFYELFHKLPMPIILGLCAVIPLSCGIFCIILYFCCFHSSDDKDDKKPHVEGQSNRTTTILDSSRKYAGLKEEGGDDDGKGGGPDFDVEGENDKRGAERKDLEMARPDNETILIRSEQDTLGDGKDNHQNDNYKDVPEIGVFETNINQLPRSPGSFPIIPRIPVGLATSTTTPSERSLERTHDSLSRPASSHADLMERKRPVAILLKSTSAEYSAKSMPSLSASSTKTSSSDKAMVRTTSEQTGIVTQGHFELVTAEHTAMRTTSDQSERSTDAHSEKKYSKFGQYAAALNRAPLSPPTVPPLPNQYPADVSASTTIAPTFTPEIENTMESSHDQNFPSDPPPKKPSYLPPPAQPRVPTLLSRPSTNPSVANSNFAKAFAAKSKSTHPPYPAPGTQRPLFSTPSSIPGYNPSMLSNIPSTTAGGRPSSLPMSSVIPSPVAFSDISSQARSTPGNSEPLAKFWNSNGRYSDSGLDDLRKSSMGRKEQEERERGGGGGNDSLMYDDIEGEDDDEEFDTYVEDSGTSRRTTPPTNVPIGGRAPPTVNQRVVPSIPTRFQHQHQHPLHASKKTPQAVPDLFADDTSMASTSSLISSSIASAPSLVSRHDESWVPDNSADDCILCQKAFSVFNRRHHCRACGRVVCGQCASSSIQLGGQGQLSRVCDECFISSRGNSRVVNL